jgi:predicted porin
MKKSLLAVAALGAFASAAQAQSSVTVYGILDEGFIGSTATLNTPSAVNKYTSEGFAPSAQSTSRLGFKGSEDLGGGMSAFFTYEIKMTPDSNQAVNSSTTQNRQSFVGLKKKGIGDFAIGTQYTLVHNAVAATDPGQQNNVLGDLIYTAGTGTALTTLVSSTGQYAYAGGTSYTIRQANALTLNTDNFGGFKGHAMFVNNNANQTQTAATTGGVSNSSGWGLGVDYTYNKLFLTANYQSFLARNTSATTSVYTLFGLGQNNSGGANVNDNQQYYAATYDFGILKAFAQYVNRQSTLNNNSAIYQKYSAEQIGVRSYVTPTIEVWASGGYGNFTPMGTSQPKTNLTAFQLGSNYWLSKRTNLYAIYGQVSQSNSTVSASVATTPSASTGYTSANANNYAVGVRHTF